MYDELNAAFTKLRTDVPKLNEAAARRRVRQIERNGGLATFEVLLASFGLSDDEGLARIGALVHHLDVGGEAVAEAAGFEAVLSGLRGTSDGDALLTGITPMLDALDEHFSRTAG